MSTTPKIQALYAALLLLTVAACDPQRTTTTITTPPTTTTHHTTTPHHNASSNPPTTTLPELDALARSLAESAARGQRGWTTPSLDTTRALVRSGQDNRAIHAIRARLRAANDDPETTEALQLMLGRLLTEARDPDALATLDALPIPTELVNSRRLLYLSRAESDAGEDARALNSSRALLQTRHALPEREQVLLQHARLLYANGETTDAHTTLAELADADSDVRADAFALKMLWEDEPEKRTRLQRQLLILYPELTLRSDGLALPVTYQDLEPGQQLLHARRLVQHFYYREAAEVLTGLLADPELGDASRLLLARIHLELLGDDPHAARALLEELLERDHSIHDTLYLLTEACFVARDYDAALLYAQRYLERFPDGEHQPRVDFLAAASPFHKRDCAAAIPALRDHSSRTRDTVSRGMIAWCHVRAQDWTAAIEAYTPLLDYRNPLVRGKALYWQAYAHVQLGQPDDAAALLTTLHEDYPLTWYDALGHQLQAQLDGNDDAHIIDAIPAFREAGRAPAILDDPTAWELPSSLRGSTRQNLKRVRRLIDILELEPARQTWESIRAAVESSVPPDEHTRFVHFTSHQLDAYYHGWNISSGNTRTPSAHLPDPADLAWQLVYPRAFHPLITQLAETHTLPWPVLDAIMLQKSRFRPWMRSNTDALGAFQTHAHALREAASRDGLDFDTRLFDVPCVAFPPAVAHLAHLHHDRVLGGEPHLLLTIAAEQRGAARIRSWLDTLPEETQRELPFLIEELDDTTTYNYTRKVAEHTLRYLYLYETDPERLASTLEALFNDPAQLAD